MQLDTQTTLEILAVTIGSGLGVTLVAQFLKKSLARFGVDSNTVIHTVVLALAGVAAAMQYVDQIHSSLPPVILGISGPAIYGFSQIIFKYASYASGFLGKVNAYNDSQKQPASSVETTTAPTASPSLPAVPEVDF